MIKRRYRWFVVVHCFMTLLSGPFVILGLIVGLRLLRKDVWNSFHHPKPDATKPAIGEKLL